MVISRQAVKDYVAATNKLRDSDKAKRFTVKALDAKLKQLDLETTTPLYRHQKICLLLGWMRKSYLFLLGMGSGKTLISLELYRNLVRHKKASRALVLVPGITNIEAWYEESRFHTPDLSVVGITMTGATARREAMINSGQVVVMTYQGFSALVCDVEEIKDSTKRKKRWVPNDKKLKEIASAFDVLILDECTAIKNPGSLQFRLCRKMIKWIDYRYGLTGTPFDKNPIDLWSQFFIADRGEALGQTLGLFREVFFSSKPRFWGGRDYTFLQGKRNMLARRMRHSSIRFREEECQDLPDAVGGLDAKDWMLRPVVMPRENYTYYEKLLNDLEDARGNYTLLEGVYMQLRMLASGFLAARDEDDERVEIVFDNNPKLDALVDLIKEIPEDEKVVVCHVFRKTSKLICDRLWKERNNGDFSYVHCFGETKNKGDALREFKEANRILVGSESIAYGLNLQRECRYMIFYESPDSTITRKQTERRIRRQGSRGSRCFYYDIVVRGSIEMRILKALREGKRLLDLLMDRRVSVGELMLSYKA